MIIRISEQEKDPALSRMKVRKAIRATLRALRLPDVEISLSFVDPATMTAYNARYLGRRGPTDVISFPAAKAPRAPRERRHLGDIVICTQTVRRYAKKHRRPFAAELRHVMVHGTLHLLGYDHGRRREAEIMRSLERRLLPHAEKAWRS